ncbi:MAG: tetratricopeptide repeat protein, partial [Myxococcales bacterium]|nr:tetratricopeptide repeat protein [Myxococcales bacterium]
MGEVRSALQGFSGGVQRNARPEPEGILRLAAELRQLPDCNDTRVLAEYRRILGLQDEPEAAKALRDELNVAHAREVLGEDLAALARVEDIIGEAQGPGFERVRAQAAYRRGRVLDAMGNTSGARQSLEEAVGLAKQTHDPVLGVMASLYLAKLLADDPTGGRGGRGWLMLAWSELRAAHGDDPPAWLHADFLDASGIVEHAAHEYARAEDFHRRALELRRKFVGGDDDPDVIRSMNNLANVLSRLGPERKAEALPLYEAARRSVERLYGADHPLNAKLWINIGVQHLDAGRTQSAKRAFLAAVEIDRRARGAAGEPALRPLVLLGKLAAEEDDDATLDAVVAQIERIHDDLRASDSAAMTHVDRANELKLIAQGRSDDLGAAAAALQEAAAILEPVEPVEHAWTQV